MPTNPKPQESDKQHHLPEGVHQDDLPWMLQRFPGQTCKMMFHPRPERQTEPNAGLVRYEPGAWHPLHSHDFAQIWYILEGEFLYGDKCFKAGTMIYHPDPHTEPYMKTETGGTILYVQYPGPTTGAAPIYDGRFNLTARKSVELEPTDI